MNPREKAARRAEEIEAMLSEDTLPAGKRKALEGELTVIGDNMAEGCYSNDPDDGIDWSDCPGISNGRPYEPEPEYLTFICPEMRYKLWYRNDEGRMTYDDTIPAELIPMYRDRIDDALEQACVAVLCVRPAVIFMEASVMSLADKSKGKKGRATRRLIDAKNLTDHSIQSYSRGEIVYFIIKPINIAMLSRSNIQIKVNGLMNMLKGMEEAEILCLNSRESFEGNKAILKARLDVEMNDAVRRLLEKDLLFLDQIQIQTASAREFLVGLRFIKEDDILPVTSRVEKLLKEQGFFARLAVKDDLKRILAVYFAQNMTQVVLDDYDGERWVAGQTVSKA